MGDDKHSDYRNLFDKLKAVLLRQSEQWETHVTHRTRCLKINVIFQVQAAS
jgi:hypothetical protein